MTASTHRRDFLKTAAASAAALAFGPATRRAAGKQSSHRPNVVLVMTDDQGYGDIGVLGNPLMVTPHLDKLHGESVRLTDFHVDPTCSPTRSALMAGRYSTKTGVWHTIQGRSLLAADEVTVADVFRAGGYATGIFGKWHLGDNYPFRPQDRGFDRMRCNGGGGVTQLPDFWGNSYFDDTYWEDGKPKKFKGYCTDVFFDGAMGFIEKCAKAGKPFFCYLPTNAAHGPYLVAEKYKQIYEKKGVKGSRAAFWGMVTNIDENMGRMVKKLADLGIAEDTILIFMTDNGTSAGSSGVYRGRKGSEYEGGHRVPFFLRWPGKVGKPRDIPNLSAHIDVLPTLADLCGVPVAPKVKARLDGMSLKPLLMGKTKGWPQRTLFVHSQRIEHPQKWRKCAVMTQRWRLVNGKELYDIQADPSQKKDVAPAHPEVVAKLRQAYEGWWKQLEPRFPQYCRIWLGSPLDNPTRLTSHDWHDPTHGVPWNQRQVTAGMRSNGWWAVHVAKGGTYEFVLRRWPEEVDKPIEADKARIKIGDVEKSMDLPAGATEATFVLDLKPGPAQLQTWLIGGKAPASAKARERKGKAAPTAGPAERGAYFVYVKRLGEDKLRPE